MNDSDASFLRYLKHNFSLNLAKFAAAILRHLCCIIVTVQSAFLIALFLSQFSL